MPKSILAQLRKDFTYEKNLKEQDSVKKANIKYLTDHYEDEILANYSGMWVLVQKESPTIIAAYDPFEMLHNLRTQMRLHRGSVLVYAAHASSLNPDHPYSPLILSVEDISLEDFLPQ